MPVQDDGKTLAICAFIQIEYHNVMDGQTDGTAKTISCSACIA